MWILGYVCVVAVFIQGMDCDHGQGHVNNKGKQEICQNEQFSGKCEHDEVIMMTDARYGRMNFSRCINKNYGHIPCQRDVLDVADLLCSGRQECTIPVPSNLLDERKTCPTDFISYLEADYLCKKVMTKHKSVCQSSDSSPNYIPLKDTKEGFLSSTIAYKTGCGSHKAPWMISADAGQTINFILHDFSYIKRTGGNASPPAAPSAYAVIKEPSISESHTIWAQDSRLTHAYMSKTNMVQVVFQGSQNTQRFFAIEFKVQGCSLPAAPKGGWVRRDGSDVVMGCNHTSSTTEIRLTCQGQTWKGKRINCASPETAAVSTWGDSMSLMFQLNLEMAVVLIAAIAFVIACIIILLGIIFLKRRNVLRYRQGHSQLTEQWNLGHSANMHGPPGIPQDYNTNTVGGGDNTKYSGSIRSQENEYASIQENLYGGPGSGNPNTGHLVSQNPPQNYTPVNLNEHANQMEHTNHVVHHLTRNSHVIGQPIAGVGGVLQNNENIPTKTKGGDDINKNNNSKVVAVKKVQSPVVKQTVLPLVNGGGSPIMPPPPPTQQHTVGFKSGGHQQNHQHPLPLVGLVGSSNKPVNSGNCGSPNMIHDERAYSY